MDWLGLLPPELVDRERDDVEAGGTKFLAHCYQFFVVIMSVTASRRHVDDDRHSTPASAGFWKVVRAGH